MTREPDFSHKNHCFSGCGFSSHEAWDASLQGPGVILHHSEDLIQEASIK